MDLKQKLEQFQPKFSKKLFLQVLATFPVLAIVIPLVIVAIPRIHFFNDMAVQPKAKTQMLYGSYFFNQGKPAVQLPAHGTIPRDVEFYSLATYSVEEIRQNEELDFLESPYEPTMEMLERGKNRYQIFCTPCHGKYGIGDGLVTKGERGENGFPVPPSFHGASSLVLSDGEVFHIISNGRNLMPGYANQLSQKDRWAVVQYVNALQTAFDPEGENQAKAMEKLKEAQERAKQQQAESPQQDSQQKEDNEKSSEKAQEAGSEEKQTSSEKDNKSEDEEK